MSPPWFFRFVELFHVLSDLLFIVFSILIVRAVSRPGWRHHLRWAVPAAAASVLGGAQHLLPSLIHFGNAAQASLIMNMLSLGLHLLTVSLSCYSLFMLWRTLRDLARHPASPDSLAMTTSQPGVWPPPPTINL